MAEEKSNRKLRFTSLTRDVFMLPVEGGMPVHEKLGFALFILGDKNDTDDHVPEGVVRDPALQPAPSVDVYPSEYAKFGAEPRRVLEEQIAMGRIARTELAI